MALSDYDSKKSWQHTARTDPQIQAWYQGMRQRNPALDSDVVVNMLHTPSEQYNYPLAINMGLKPSYQPEHQQYRWNDIGKGSGQGGMVPAMIRQESAGNPRATSDKGAAGLMQIMPSALDDYNKSWGTSHTMEDMYNPEINRRVGVWYVGERIPQLLNAYKIPVTAENMLWAYNGGIGNVDRGVKPSETKGYITKVTGYMKGKQ